MSITLATWPHKRGRKPRLYSLFEKIDGRWIRISQFAFIKATAVQHWQGQLLSGYFSGRHLELRALATGKKGE